MASTGTQRTERPPPPRIGSVLSTREELTPDEADDGPVGVDGVTRLLERSGPNGAWVGTQIDLKR
jgi:hypothetical protein